MTTKTSFINRKMDSKNRTIFLIIIIMTISFTINSTESINNNGPYQIQNGFNFYAPNEPASETSQAAAIQSSTSSSIITNQFMRQQLFKNCSNGLLTFELSTGFIYKPSAPETLAMMPGTLQLTDCLDYCLHNNSCLAINFEMGLCVLLSSSAKQNMNNLYSSQFPVFTIYAEKKCLLEGKSAFFFIFLSQFIGDCNYSVGLLL